MVVYFQVKHVASLLGDGTYVTQSKIKFPVSMADHNRNIVCKASNEVTDHLKPQKSEILLNVKFAPLISVREPSIRIKEGRDLNISCDYYANPSSPVSVTWLKDNMQISTDNSSKYVTKDKASWLIIKTVTVQDEGNYTCAIRNIIGEGKPEHPIHVEILTLPQE